MSSDEIRQRLGLGALIAVFRGVYRVGHVAPSELAWYLAAVKACGEGALLCGLAAAHLWGLVKGAAPAPEVTTRTVRRVPCVKTRRGVDARDATSRQGIPITSVARTLVDLAAVVDAETLARACHEAGVKYRTTPAQVEALLARRPNAPGAAKLRAVLRGDTKVTLSRLESLFIAVLREHNLPLPTTNKPAGSKRVDCRWPQHSLTAELDSYRFHNSRHAWEQSYRREREAHARGDQFRRYTWTDVAENLEPLLTDLRRLLPAGGPGRRTGRRASA